MHFLCKVEDYFRMNTHQEAAKAIVDLNGKVVNGSAIKVSYKWVCSVPGAKTELLNWQGIQKWPKIFEGCFYSFCGLKRRLGNTIKFKQNIIFSIDFIYFLLNLQSVNFNRLRSGSISMVYKISLFHILLPFDVWA